MLLTRGANPLESCQTYLHLGATTAGPTNPTGGPTNPTDGPTNPTGSPTTGIQLVFHYNKP